ncbi:hypothetical protein FRC20_000313, partial [Serendipita sp. 405]
AHLWANYTNIIYLNTFCFHKFVWNITKPDSSRKFYDNRTKYNRIDVFMTTILPILWMPVVFVTLNGRYVIIEDLGPLYIVSKSLETILIRCIPTLLITIASVWVVVLTMINIWHARHIEPPKRVNELNHLRFDRTLSRKKTIRYLALSITALISLVFGCIWTFMPILRDSRTGDPWWRNSDIRGNIRQLPLIHSITRYQLNPNSSISLKVFFISIPVTGIITFIFFGLGPEAIKAYHGWLQTLSSLLKLPALFRFLRTHMLGFCWLNQRLVLVNPEYFIPFGSNDITLDPYPLVDLPRMPKRPLIQSLSTQPRIKPSFHPAPSHDIQQGYPPPRRPLEQWRTYHKQPITVDLHPTHQYPGLPQFLHTSKDEQDFMPSSRWRTYRKESVQPPFAP